MTKVLIAKNISKSFVDGKKHINVLSQVNLSFNANEMTAIIGRSGCGKSTFLHILGGLDVPCEGEIYWGEQAISCLREGKKSRLRNRYLGFVYQFHHLLAEFCAWENVALPLMLSKHSPRHAKQQALALLKQVELADRAYHKIGQLSGGERQRVAIARALVTQPKCVLADEPTGNLDEATSQHVLQLLQTVQRQHEAAFVIVTHDHEIARLAQRRYVLEQGSFRCDGSE